MSERRGKQNRLFWALIFYFLVFPPGAFSGEEMNGFRLTNPTIPLEEIRFGGPGKDGIPALHYPKFISVSKATFLRKDDRILGLSIGGESKAYPIRILNWHEVVNDRLGGRPVLMTYCPLCGTGMAFDPVINGKRFTFGVSGLLYQSDVLMYDHQTESLWSQIRREGVTGKMAGAKLPLLTTVHTTWSAWKKAHPGTLVLSTDTGYSRDYQVDPYRSYAESTRLMFPPKHMDRRLGPKEWVLGVAMDGLVKAYPFSELEKGPESIIERVGGEKIYIHYDSKTRTARVENIQGETIPSVVAYWFAWAAFYPDTQIYRHRPAGN